MPTFDPLWTIVFPHRNRLLYQRAQMKSHPGFAEFTVEERGAVLGSGASGRNNLKFLLQILDVNIEILGRVWRATMKRAGESDKVVALKTSHTCKKVANLPLRHEACALLALQGESSESCYL